VEQKIDSYRLLQDENSLTPFPSYLSIEGLSILSFGPKPYDNPIEAYFRNEGGCGWHGELGGAEWRKPEEVP
jgi:hypothetical protein